jgi:hypothetical protein
VHDRHAIPQLLHGAEQEVHGDSAYRRAALGTKLPLARCRPTAAPGRILEATNGCSMDAKRVQPRLGRLAGLENRERQLRVDTARSRRSDAALHSRSARSSAAIPNEHGHRTRLSGLDRRTSSCEVDLPFAENDRVGQLYAAGVIRPPEVEGRQPV